MYLDRELSLGPSVCQAGAYVSELYPQSCAFLNLYMVSPSNIPAQYLFSACVVFFFLFCIIITCVRDSINKTLKVTMTNKAKGQNMSIKQIRWKVTQVGQSFSQPKIVMLGSDGQLWDDCSTQLVH